MISSPDSIGLSNSHLMHTDLHISCSFLRRIQTFILPEKDLDLYSPYIITYSLVISIKSLKFQKESYKDECITGTYYHSRMSQDPESCEVAVLTYASFFYHRRAPLFMYPSCKPEKPPKWSQPQVYTAFQLKD